MLEFFWMKIITDPCWCLRWKKVAQMYRGTISQQEYIQYINSSCARCPIAQDCITVHDTTHSVLERVKIMYKTYKNGRK